MGETLSSGATAEECEDPLTLLDPKEELLSETESLEMDEEDKSDVPANMDISHKVSACSPTQSVPPPPLSPQGDSAVPRTFPAMTNSNNGKFLLQNMEFIVEFLFIARVKVKIPLCTYNSINTHSLLHLAMYHLYVTHRHTHIDNIIVIFV